ncbi:hypothetical protein [Desulfurispora thermophila]|uniref:hypothetical protein n=1 Tax=Desulfurispora thermophila TaxID=265470 RepID=UPI0003784435|nr:hypothetical protein [Desulfurispora thermophila]
MSPLKRITGIIKSYRSSTDQTKEGYKRWDQGRAGNAKQLSRLEGENRPAT